MIQEGEDGGHTHVNIGAHLFWYISVYFSFLWDNFFLELDVTKHGMRRKEEGGKNLQTEQICIRKLN